MLPNSRTCTWLIFALGISQVLGGAVYETAQPVFGDPSDFKVAFTSPGPGSGIAPGQTAFNQTVPQMLTLTIEPCGVLAAHVHPRGTEFDFVTTGTFEVGFFLENATFLTVQYAPGDGIVIPQGTVHYVRNTGCSTAEVFAYLDHPDPGTIFVGQALSALPPVYLDSAITAGPNFNASGPFFNLHSCKCPPQASG